jgi:hypothetical protein
MLFESEESKKSLPCILDIRRKVLQKELAIQITDDTILLLRNRQRAKLEDFKVGDKINVYGLMDKDNNAIDALIVRNIVSVPKPIFRPIEPKLPVTSTPRVCIQVITPAYNPQNPLECKEFPTPCDVPPGWLKIEKCPVRTQAIIQVISPNGGEKLEIGKTYEIRWYQQTSGDVLVHLERKKSHPYECSSNFCHFSGWAQFEHVDNIIDGEFNAGLHTIKWLIPNNIEPGEDYAICALISNGFGQKYDCSDAPFTILKYTQSLTEAKVEADDYGFYPSSLEFTKGSKVKLYLYVRSSNVYYGGLDFRSEKFKTEPVRPGQKAEVEFIADKDFVIESYWPLSNVKKAELKIIVK